MEQKLIFEMRNQLHDAKRQLDSALSRLLRRWDLTENAFRILYVLSCNPDGMEPALIAEHASMLRSAVCPILNKFEKQQLITRQEHQDDHRRKIITLTESGSFFAREVKDTCFRVEEKAFARFSTSEIQQMISVFACITQALMEEVIVDEKTEEKYKND